MAEEQHTGRSAPSQARVTRENYCKATVAEVVCVGCPKTFLSLRKGHSYCSTKCYRKIYNRKKISRPGPRKCGRCPTLFIPKTVWQVFCSPGCRQRVPITYKHCKICKIKFLPTKRRNQKYCSIECRKKGYRNAVRKYKKKNDAQSRCHHCSNPKLPGSGYLCEKHWFSKIIKSAGFYERDAPEKAKRLLESQGYKCPYTGRRIVLGVNASIDHKNPKARFPDQRCLWENIEWVDIDVNSAKRNLTKTEFISMCSLISSKFQK